MRVIAVWIVFACAIFFANDARAKGGFSYFCEVDFATGFSFDGDKWGRTDFRASGSYLIKPYDEKEREKYLFGVSDDDTYLVYQSGSQFPFIGCKDAFEEKVIGGSSAKAVGYLYCGNHINGFAFNRFNLRFSRSSLSGYTNVVPGVNTITDEESDTPFIEIGTCRPL